MLHRVGLDLPPTTPVSTLTAGQMQMVEIARRLRGCARDHHGQAHEFSDLWRIEQLFKIIGELKAKGIGIIYISHRMEEVLRLADRITILRDGANRRFDSCRSDARQDRFDDGRPGVQTRFPDRSEDSLAETRFCRFENIRVPGAPAGVSFMAQKGEIIGFAGLVGSGRTELMQVIFGVDPRRADDVVQWVPYFPPTRATPSIAASISCPKTASPWVGFADVGGAKYVSAQHRQLHPEGLAQSPHRAAQSQKKKSQRMRIKTPSVHRKVVNLSGGNQQKVVLGKWLAMNPKILILDEPTRGIDVGAKAEIYRAMAELAEQGITILMVSSEMEEVIGMSDRVVVMHERKIKSILPRKLATQERMGSLMPAGIRRCARASDTMMNAHRIGRKECSRTSTWRREMGMLRRFDRDVRRAVDFQSGFPWRVQYGLTPPGKSQCWVFLESAFRFVIVAGGIDLSVGSIIGLTGVSSRNSPRAQRCWAMPYSVGIPLALGDCSCSSD